MRPIWMSCLSVFILLSTMLQVTWTHQNHPQQTFGAQQAHVHNQAPQQQFQQQAQANNQQQNQQHMFDKSHVQDREHIKEHLEGVIPEADTSKMSSQELQFHYFKMHDTDNNNKLDGSELIKSLIHWHVTEGSNPNSQVPPKVFGDYELEMLIDPIMLSDDVNRDGFVDYPEFSAAQSRMSSQ